MKKVSLIGFLGIMVILFLFILSPGGSSQSEELGSSTILTDATWEPVDQIDIVLGISFPPVQDDAELAFTQEQLEALQVQHIRIAEDWAFRESIPGEYNWSPLDMRIAWAEENDISLLLTIQSNGPDWACDPDKQNERSCVYLDPDRFSQYITDLLSRYPNQIEKIQFGNEWLSDFWYPGSAEDYVLFNNILYEAVQEISPDTEFVLGGFATGQLQRLAFCDGLVDQFTSIDGELVSQEEIDYCQSQEYLNDLQRFENVITNARYDLIDLHFYDDVENWIAYYQAVMAYFPDQTPVIVSEFGGPNLFYEQPYSDQYQAERLALYIETLQQMGVLEAYYFKLVQSRSAHPSHWESGLFEEVDGQPLPKPAFSLFQMYSTQP